MVLCQLRRLWCNVLLGVVMLLTSAVCIAEVLRICSKCGQEATGANAVCEHCGAVFPAVPTNVVAPTAAEPSVLPARVESSVVLEEVNLGRQALEKNRVDLAKLYLRNALAMDLLAGKSQDLSAQIGSLIQKCKTGRGTLKVRCTACDGTGHRTARSTSMAAREMGSSIGGVPCPQCGGTGYQTRPGAIADRKYTIGQAMSDYRTAQQSRHYVSVGSAWIPGPVEETLDVKSRAAVLRCTAAPCGVCLGLGLADCPTCSGMGRVKCPNRSCAGGMVTVKSESRLGRDLERQERCKICGGIGVISCDKCRSSGSVLCKSCNGTGERAQCSRCGGEGVMHCQRCGGMGRVGEAACKSCGGKGDILCVACQGDGRKR
jgi:hypothetical protein